MPIAIVSAHDKRGLAPFMKGLASESWDMFASPGSQRAYYEGTGRQVPSLEDYVEQVKGRRIAGRAEVARAITGLILRERNVGLVCVNLRPYSREYGPDFGRASMLDAACISRAIVITNPNRYDDLLDRLSYGNQPSEDFLWGLRAIAQDHISLHLPDTITTEAP